MDAAQPTWANIMHGVIAALEHGSEEGKRLARFEILALARKLDHDDLQRANKAQLKERCQNEI